jgi:Trk K+ transport system NAD-binding subunit
MNSARRRTSKHPKTASGAGAVGDGVTLVEAVVPDGARIAGKTVEAVGLAWRQNTTLMGIARRGADHQIAAQDGDRARRHPAPPGARRPGR